MRTEEEVKRELQIICQTYLRKRLNNLVRRSPFNCTHHLQHSLDVRKLVGGEPNSAYNRLENPGTEGVGLCMLGSDNHDTWAGNICEDMPDALKCSNFHPKSSKSTLIEEFHKNLKDRDWLKVNLPEASVLAWVLGYQDGVKYTVSWWSRLLLKLGF